MRGEDRGRKGEVEQRRRVKGKRKGQGMGRYSERSCSSKFATTPLKLLTNHSTN